MSYNYTVGTQQSIEAISVIYTMNNDIQQNANCKYYVNCSPRTSQKLLTQFMGKTVACLLYIHVACTCSLTNKVILTQIYEDTYEVTSVQLVIFHKRHDGIVSAFHHG